MFRRKRPFTPSVAEGIDLAGQSLLLLSEAFLNV